MHVLATNSDNTSQVYNIDTYLTWNIGATCFRGEKKLEFTYKMSDEN